MARKPLDHGKKVNAPNDRKPDDSSKRLESKQRAERLEEKKKEVHRSHKEMVTDLIGKHRSENPDFWPMKASAESGDTKAERDVEERRLADLAIGDDQSTFDALDKESKKEWERVARERVKFSQDCGNELQDNEWMDEIRRKEAASGRVEGEDKDFAFRVSLPHPDGNPVEYDYVDFRNHRIVDLKPAMDGQKSLRLATKYLQQQRRHIEAYRAKYGVEPTYDYSLYPSTKHLFEQKK